MLHITTAVELGEPIVTMVAAVGLENTMRYLSKLYGTLNIGCTGHYKIARAEKF